MSTLLAEIDAASTRRGPDCAVAVVLTELPADDADDLRIALSNVRYTATSIAKTLTTRGFRIGDTSINRHRRGSCRCQTS